MLSNFVDAVDSLRWVLLAVAFLTAVTVLGAGRDERAK